MNPGHKRERQPGGPFEPSPRDIRRACERIQSTWSDRERTKRSGNPPEGQWVPPSVNWSALTEAALEDQGADMAPNGNGV